LVIENGVDHPASESHLFTIRLWWEDLGRGQTDWRGKVQHVNSGEARYFRDWHILEAFLEELIHKTLPKEDTSHGRKAIDKGPR
jgi:hypothetical protein